ncbi:hypothetical protein [Streptomyces buecherae]|uniref:hypothetical protein n=1 Tax=Streptomyces buecherae TaxID=2763006 RepID=UPI00369F6139
MTNGVLDGSKHVPAHPRGASRTDARRTGRPPAPRRGRAHRTDRVDGAGSIEGIGR